MEQNGGSCAGERSGGGGGGRAALGEGARGPRGSPGWGLPGPAPSPCGAPSRRLAGLRAFPASGPGGLCHPLPPGPTPWARGWGAGTGAPRREQPIALRSHRLPAEGGLPRALGAPGTRDGGRPPAASALRGLPHHPRRPGTNNKKRAPLSPAFPPPSSSRPPMQETPFRPPSHGCALRSRAPNHTAPRPSSPVLQNGCFGQAGPPPGAPGHGEGAECPHRR